MDNHLNLFYSYSQGRLNSDIDSENTLEDNVTRALIVTLQKNPELTQSIIEKYFNLNKFSSKTDFKYDLQNLEEKKVKSIQKYKSKFILGISNIEEDNNNITKEKLIGYKNEHVEQIVNWFDENYKNSKLDDQNSKKAIGKFRTQLKSCIDEVKKLIEDELNVKDLNSERIKNRIEESARKIFYDKENKERFESLIIKNFEWATLDVLKYINDVSNDSRADAWIWTEGGKNDFVVLIENKINGSLYEEQIIRHIKRNNGLLTDIKKVDIKILTWKEIYKDLKKFKLSQFSMSSTNKIGEFLLNNFINYLGVNNMGDFIGFNQEDFSLNERSQTWKKMKNLLDYSFLDKFSKDDLKYFDGRGQSELISLQKSTGELKVYLGLKNIQNYVHYTFVLNNEGFSINISFPSNKFAHKSVVELIKKNLDQFKKLISSQEFSYYFKIHAKHKWLNKTGIYAPNKVQSFSMYGSYLTKFLEQDHYGFYHKNYDFNKVKSQSTISKDFYELWANNVFSEIEKINNPFIVIEKKFPIRYILSQGKNFEDVIYNVIKDLFPIYKFLTI